MLKWLIVLLKRFNCLLNGGHYNQIRWDHRRVWLECENCRLKSTGWEVRDGPKTKCDEPKARMARTLKLLRQVRRQTLDKGN